MALTPRCYLAGNGSGTSASPPLTGWTNAGLGVTGTAPQAGDIVVLIGTINSSTPNASQSGGTGTWTFQATGDGNSGGALSSYVAWRVFDGTETAPTFSWGTTLRNDWSVIALAPDSGDVASIDVWATLVKDTTGATSHTANSATAADTGEVSLLLIGALASVNGTTPVSFTAPTGWTIGGTGQANGGPSSKGQGAAIMFDDGVSGTVTPGAISSNVSTFANVYHVLIQETTTTVSGSASLAATGTIAASGTVLHTGSATLAAAGSTTASAKVTHTGAATLTSTGNLTASGNATHTGAVTYQATGTLAVAGTTTGAPNPPPIQYPTSALITAPQSTATITTITRAATLGPTSTRTAAITRITRAAHITASARTATVTPSMRAATLAPASIRTATITPAARTAAIISTNRTATITSSPRAAQITPSTRRTTIATSTRTAKVTGSARTAAITENDRTTTIDQRTTTATINE